MAGDGDGVFVRQASAGVRRGDLAHRHGNHTGGFSTCGTEVIRQRNLDSSNANLGAFGVVVFLVVINEFDQRPPGFALNEFIQLINPALEEERLFVQVFGHLAVLGTETGVDPHHSPLCGSVGAHHRRAGLALGDTVKGRLSGSDSINHCDSAGASIRPAAQCP